MHLYYPPHSASTSQRRLHSFLSPPRHSPSFETRIFFSIFYTAAVVFPMIVTLVYWLIIFPHNRSPGESTSSVATVSH